MLFTFEYTQKDGRMQDEKYNVCNAGKINLTFRQKMLFYYLALSKPKITFL